MRLLLTTSVLLLAWACVESNPQPSPGGGKDQGQTASIDIENNYEGVDTIPAPRADTADHVGDAIAGAGDAADTEGAADTIPEVLADVVTDLLTDTSPDAPQDTQKDSTPDIQTDLAADLATDLPHDAPCVPSCEGKECGDDGCGGTCGTCSDECPLATVCNASGQCVPTCAPDCMGKFCGDDGCGCPCGTCAPDEACQEGQCVQTGIDCDTPKTYPDCKWDLPEDLCVYYGGTWGAWGLSPEPTCMCPTGDAGCPCTAESQCQGMCYAEMGDKPCNTLTEGKCSATAIMFGCFCLFGEEGQPPAGICID